MKTVVVTGASRGLGLGVVERLLTDGYRVIAVARRTTERLTELQAQVNGGEEARLHLLHHDLSDLAGIHGLCQQIVAIDRNLYGLVNNAALGLEGVLATQHERDIAQLLTVNLHAPILLCKYLSRAMLVRGEGRIVQISSIIAENGFNGLAVYGATKAGLVGLTRSLSREVGKAGITVNCVCPGYMETDMTAGLQGDKLESIRRRSPFRKFPGVADVAGAVSFLLGPDAALITGTTLTVDAGSSA